MTKLGRPIKLDKKKSIHLKIPPYLIDWLDRQPESRALLIEVALNSHFQIPSHLKPEMNKNSKDITL